ncbi:MAG: glycosyltransferase [Candidatus Stahlbacteria bacterium]|nr:glycosyltransferase [Candidatus Stahlbacteria bacterium]
MKDRRQGTENRRQKKRVLIFTSIERAFYSSIIEYQLLEPIVEVSKNSGNKFIYVGFIPITFWFTRQEVWKSFWAYRKNRHRIKHWLTVQGIQCNFIPIIFPIRHKDFYLRIPWLCLYLLNTLPLLLYIIMRYRVNLIHVRNYPAAILCFFIRSIFGLPYNFDMRDLYPEKGIEAQMFGKWKMERGATSNGKWNIQYTWSYKLWKFIELKLLHSASSIIVTSEPFKEYIETIFLTNPAGAGFLLCSNLMNSTNQTILIPNSVNIQRFKPNLVKRREIRVKYGLSDKFVLLHSGAFGTQQDIPLVGQYFLKWKSLKPKDAHLVILCGTKKYLPNIRRIIEGVGVSKENYTLLNPIFDEVPQLLLLGDVGLHLESLALATPYCIAVKDGEYLATGLPIIVTKWLKGINGMIKKYNAGIVIDPNDKSYIQENKLLENYDKMSENAGRLVKECLSLEKCVEKFNELYI